MRIRELCRIWPPYISGWGRAFSDTDLDSLTVVQSQLIDSGGVKYIGLALRTQNKLSFVTTLSFRNQYAHLLSRAHLSVSENLDCTLRAIGELDIIEYV